jgi:hypothetical protein
MIDPAAHPTSSGEARSVCHCYKPTTEPAPASLLPPRWSVELSVAARPGPPSCSACEQRAAPCCVAARTLPSVRLRSASPREEAGAGRRSVPDAPVEHDFRSGFAPVPVHVGPVPPGVARMANVRMALV